jgi:hypothetical protein
MKVRSNESVIITVNFSQRERLNRLSQRLNSAKGIINEAIQDDYIPRRLQKDIYLNFWDLGQFTEDDGETWSEFDWTVTKSLILDGSNYAQDLEALNLTDWTLMTDQMLSLGIENWKDIFRKLDYETAERYGVDIYLGKITGFGGTQGLDISKYFPVGRDGSRNNVAHLFEGDTISDSKWEEKGLKVEDKQTTQEFNLFTSNGFVNLMQSTSTNYYKVTEEPSFSSDGVEFLIDSSVDFYLVPMFVIEEATATRSGNNLILNYIYAPLSRNFFITGNGWNPVEWDYSPFTKINISYVGTSSSRSDELLNFMKGRSEARAYQEPTGTVSPSTFPLGGEEIQIDLSGIVAFDAFTSSYADVVEGSLVAVAKKKNKWYYFWSNVTKQNWNSSGSTLPRYPRFIYLIEE